jgi:hypothetical protein
MQQDRKASIHQSKNFVCSGVSFTVTHENCLCCIILVGSAEQSTCAVCHTNFPPGPLLLETKLNNTDNTSNIAFHASGGGREMESQSIA